MQRSASIDSNFQVMPKPKNPPVPRFARPPAEPKDTEIPLVEMPKKKPRPEPVPVDQRASQQSLTPA